MLDRSSFARPWVLVDIGNQRCKAAVVDGAVWEPADTIVSCSLTAEQWSDFVGPLRDARAEWWISSVHRPTASRLIDWIARHRPGDAVCSLAHDGFAMQIDVESPRAVGIDRLAAAQAASWRLEDGQSAVVIDVGTAVTVDVVSISGESACFRGGAILPGPGPAAQSLETATDALVSVPFPRDAPAPLGRDTTEAVQAGLYWGLVGSVRELVRQIVRRHGEPALHVVSGGQCRPLLDHLAGPIVHDPELVLRGVGMAARAATSGRTTS